MSKLNIFDFQDLFVPIIVLGGWTLYSIIYAYNFKKNQTDPRRANRRYFNNPYIFDSLPPVFPTLGILCTAYGITIGIWHFDTSNIQASIPELLKGLRLAFIATMGGIVGLIVFQKANAVIQRRIDNDPNRPKRQTDELSAISNLTFSVEKLQKSGENQSALLIQSISEIIESKVKALLVEMRLEYSDRAKIESENQRVLSQKISSIYDELKSTKTSLVDEVGKLREEQTRTSQKANNNTDEIIRAMSDNNLKTEKKFDEFSVLLGKNNTEALVSVMKNATEQFNSQMSELINRLVKENFSELNNSVKSLNDWQRENKEQIQKLTENFKKTTELFEISSTTLKEVALNTKMLIDDDSKLNVIVSELNKVMIEDGKFQLITQQLTETVSVLQRTTDSFDETTHKLNDWVKTEKNFKEAALIIIKKLEEFRDLNGDVWDKYRKEMSAAVSIVKDTSKRLGEDLDNINGEFYARLNDTLENLDQCIQRFLPSNR